MDAQVEDQQQTLTDTENTAVPVVKKVRKRKKAYFPRGIDIEDAERLIDAPDMRYITGLRNRLVMEMMLRCGMRVSEVCNLKVRSLKRNENWRVEIRDGKTGDRNIWVPREMRPTLEIWLLRRSKECPKNDYLFCTTQGTRLDRNYVAQMMIRMCKRAGIARTHPHALRHTYAHTWLNEHKSVAALQKALGHTTSAMTLRYATAHDEDVERLMTG
jgi:integrase/recombinase XerD